MRRELTDAYAYVQRIYSRPDLISSEPRAAHHLRPSRILKMAPPPYVQAIVGLSQCIFMVIGIRDITAPGTPL